MIETENNTIKVDETFKIENVTVKVIGRELIYSVPKLFTGAMLNKWLDNNKKELRDIKKRFNIR